MTSSRSGQSRIEAAENHIKPSFQDIRFVGAQASLRPFLSPEQPLSVSIDLPLDR